MDNLLKDTYWYQENFYVFWACSDCIKHHFCRMREIHGEPKLYTGEDNG